MGGTAVLSGPVVFVFLGVTVCGWVWAGLVVLLAGYSGLALGLLTWLVWLVMCLLDLGLWFCVLGAVGLRVGVYSWYVGLFLWLLLTLFGVCWLLDFASGCCCDGFVDCVLLLLIWLVGVWFGWVDGLVGACVVVVVVCWCDCLRCTCFRLAGFG